MNIPSWFKRYGFLALAVLALGGVFLFSRTATPTEMQTLSDREYRHINPEDYRETLTSNPLWYLEMDPILREYFYDYLGFPEDKTTEWLETRQEYIDLFGDALERGMIALGTSGPSLDEEREPLTTLLIHHTATEKTISTRELDALGLLRVYARYHSDPTRDGYAQPIRSGHYRNGKQTFITYNYLVRSDGTVEHILQDNEIGWQAGFWDMNKKSIGIAFVDNLSNSRPTPEALAAARNIVTRYDQVERVEGHREVHRTTCPGELFLGAAGWKKELLQGTKFSKNQNFEKPVAITGDVPPEEGHGCCCLFCGGAQGAPVV